MGFTALWGLCAALGGQRGRRGGVGEAQGEGGGPGESPRGCLQMEVASLAGEEGEQRGDIGEPSAYTPPVEHNTW